MSTNQGHGARCKALKQDDEYQNTLKSQMPHLTRLFQNLEAGYTPNFLDMISALSEMVAFYSNSDQFDEAVALLDERMSENKCRFCS